MRFSHFTLVTALGLSQALSTSHSHKVDLKVLNPRLDQLPTCAVRFRLPIDITFGCWLTMTTDYQTSCFLNALSESPCKTVDITCICSNMDSITVDMLPCTMGNCSTMDVLRTKRYADITCGVPVRNISSRLIVSEWALFSIALVFVGLRFIARMPRFGSRLGWDDWTILVVLALSLLVNILSHFLLQSGVGQDIWMLEEYQLVSFQKVSVFCRPSPLEPQRLMQSVLAFRRNNICCRGNCA